MAKNSAKSLPKGYKALTGFGDSWPGQKPKKGATLEGKILKFDATKQTRQEKQGKKTVEKKVTVKICRIQKADGSETSVWESAGMKPLFALKKGTSVFIRFEGMGKAKPGFNAPKLYTIAHK